ncbi:hypothetical protein L210DRAFT_2609626 [Boletus edulis BED1]|uniref:Uncharacterized protein n=1 Tax=Boletus edulis BED1 TaxID=1328754 RepID=A0AAD4BBL0_BOLED|nr:hypothetical protein L210DRAFT_2609626 [Boletus edulis BED1]
MRLMKYSSRPTAVQGRIGGSKGLQEEIQSFIDWNKPQSMILVWKAVERAGSVVVSRLRRLLAGQARGPRSGSASSSRESKSGGRGGRWGVKLSSTSD